MPTADPTVYGGSLPEVQITAQRPPSSNSNFPTSSVLGSLIQMFGNMFTTWQQHKYQLEYMDKTQQQAIENWERENEYNLPSNVKKRLIDAGLNPNLLYGSGASGGQGGTISQSSAPEAFAANPFGGVSQLIQAIQQSQLTQSQIELNKANARKSRSEAEESAHNVSLIDAELRHYGLYDQLTEAQINQINTNCQQIQTSIQGMQIDNIRNFLGIFEDLTNLKYLERRLIADCYLTESQAYEVALNCQYLFRTLDARVEREGLTNEYISSQIISMLPQVVQGLQYKDRYLDENGNLNQLGKDRFQTDIVFDRTGEVVEVLSNVVNTAAEVYSAANTRGMSKALQQSARNSAERNRIERYKATHPQRTDTYEEVDVRNPVVRKKHKKSMKYRSLQ